jgi:hypothetical protein
MTDDLKRQLGIGQSSMARRLKDYADPFEPEQPKPTPDLETDADAWAKSVKDLLGQP